MKKHHVVINLAVIITLFIGAVYTAIQQDEHRIFYSVRKYTNKHGNAVVSLETLTNFSWDEALYFMYPTSPQEIEDALGVKYTGRIDLVSGLIFVRGGEIVYYELFTSGYDDLDWFPSKFGFNPNLSRADGERMRIFMPSDNFEIKKLDSGYYFMGSLD